MKHTLLASFLMVVGCSLSSQAVVIGWAGSSLLDDTTSAMLVYVASGTPTYDGTVGNLTVGEQVGSRASGGAIVGGYILPQTSEDTTTRGSGVYYVVLFKGGYYSQEYAVSTTSIAYDDPMISTGELDPISGYFAPSSFGGWNAVPEPCTATLLCLGAAAVALRRRQRG